MGGKKNQAQRTKNNVKPSSSSRSANLLGNDATKLVGFVSLKQNVFAGKSDILAEDYESIDPNFQVALKKLSKKDAVTKQKGLQELTELSKGCTPDDCKALLPYWSKLYCTLALDVDNKVRENVQVAHKAIVSNVGRNLAPFLRQIAPHWFASQFDTYPPAASVASSTFTSTFPDNKLKEVISFCHDEIFNFLYDNLINQTPQSLAKADMGKEDVESKYERVVICCLNGYAHYVETLSSGMNDDSVTKFEEANKQILSSSKYWSFASHKAPLIRAAWYTALISLCKNSLQSIKSEAKHVLKAVFSNLDETDPLTLPLVWESALYSLQIINECCEQISLETVIFPKLCNILDKGGLGNAVTIYPNLLPFLSNISASLSTDKFKFFDSFFQSLHSGLKQHTVKLSHSESEVIVNTYMECFRYVLMLHSSDGEFCLHMIDHQLMKLLKNVMNDVTHKGIVTPLYLALSELTLYWQRNVETFPTYCNLLDRFWTEFTTLCLHCLDEAMLDSALAQHVFYSHYKFLEAFLKPHTRNKKSLKVKFDIDEIPSDMTIIEEGTAELNIDPKIKTNLDSLTKSLLHSYYTLMEGEVSTDFKNSLIKQLSLVVKLVGFNFFISSCSLQGTDFCLELRDWLKSEKVPVEPVLVLTFTALASLTDEKLKKSLLEDLIQVRPEILINEAVKLCFLGKGEYPDINSWLKTDNVKDVLLSFFDSIHSQENDRNFSVLKFCLTACRMKEYVIGDKTVAKVLEKLSTMIEDASSSEILLIATLLEDVFREDTELFYRRQSQSIFTLFKTIFKYSFTAPDNSLMRILKKGISCCLCVLDIESSEFKTFIYDCSILISESFESSDSSNSLKDLLGIVKICYHLINCISSASGGGSKRQSTALKLSKDLITSVFSFSKTSLEQKIETICLIALKIHGEVSFEDYHGNYISLVEGIWDPLREINLLSYSRSVLFCVKLIFCLLGEKISETPGSEGTDALIGNGDLNHLEASILDFSYALTLLRTVSKYYSSAEQFFKSSELIEPLAPCLKELTQRLDESSYPQLFSLLNERVPVPQSLWKLTDEILRIEFLEMEVSKGESSNERILTEGLEASSLRALRIKLKSNTRDLETSINYICWKFHTYNKVESTSAYNKSINSLGYTELCLSIEMARFLTELIKYDDNIIEKKTWDFIMNSLAAWVQSIETSADPKYYNEFVGFVVAVCDLFVTFSAYLGSDSSEDSQTPTRVERNKYIRKSWDIFASDVHTSIFSIWKKLAEKCCKFQMEPVCLLQVESLSNAVCHIVQGGKLSFEQGYQLISLTKSAADLVLSPCPAVQITAFLTLQSFVSQLAKLDAGLDENSAHKVSLLLLKETLLKTQTVVEVMLQDYRLGVMLLVAPHTDSYSYTRAYLMTWLVLLDIFKAADSQVRHLYTCWMKEERLLNHLMDCLLHLLPNVVVFASDSSAKKIQEIFSLTPSYSYSGWTSGKLSTLSGFVYIHVLRVLPLLSRLWYSESEPKKRDFVDKFTAPYVSPLLINEEINYALNETKKCENLSLETLPTARLVNAIFSVEDSQAELGIQLAHNHPFTPPKVDISKSVVSSGQTKHKLKQLTLFPTLQNGSLWDCIIVWKNYLDKKFEDVEECYICYSVLHYGTHQLPKLSCRTCKKRFHSACLYKWFTSSNKSTCPICRNLF